MHIKILHNLFVAGMTLSVNITPQQALSLVYSTVGITIPC
jgi:hypothetical protein